MFCPWPEVEGIGVAYNPGCLIVQNTNRTPIEQWTAKDFKVYTEGTYNQGDKYILKLKIIHWCQDW